MKSLQFIFYKQKTIQVCVLTLITAVLTTGCSIKDKLQNFSIANYALNASIDVAEKSSLTPFEHVSPELTSFYQPVIHPRGVSVLGPLDMTFNGSGMSILPFGGAISNARAHAVAIQADGKIVVIGNANNNSHVVLARYNINGRFDPTFGKDGKVAASSLIRSASAVAIQTDGKIVVSGMSYDSKSINPIVSLVRYNTDGSIDSGFGTGGIATKSISFASVVKTSLAIQTDGKIVVLGNEPVAGSIWGINSSAFTLLRFNKDGSLDSTFGNNGKVSTGFSGSTNVARAVAIQADGKIVAVGWSAKAVGITQQGGRGADFSLARYNTNGSLDTSFGVGGRMTTDAGGSEAANAVAIQADGKIVVAGSVSAPPPQDRPQGVMPPGIGLVRYNPNGSPDQTFAAGGMVKTLVKSREIDAQAVAIQPNGKIVVVSGKNFSVLRYTTDGHLDTGFGAGGESIVKPIPKRVFVAGKKYSVLSYTSDAHLAPDVVVDDDIHHLTGTATHVGSAVAIQADGKIVAVGSCGERCQTGTGFITGQVRCNTTFDNEDFAVVRYLP